MRNLFLLVLLSPILAFATATQSIKGNLKATGTGSFGNTLTLAPGSNPNLVLSGGPSNSAGVIQLKNLPASGKYNWLWGANYNAANTWELTPSTATDGTTFSTPLLTLSTGGALTVGAAGGAGLSTINGFLVVKGTGTGQLTIEDTVSHTTTGLSFLSYKASSSTLGVVGFAEPNSFRMDFLVNSSVGSFRWTKSSSVFGEINQNGIWTIGETSGTQTHILNGALRTVYSGTTLNYPTSDGSNGQVLKTDGSGNLSFASVSSIGGLEAKTNQLYNANFAIWQRGTSTTVANGATGYQADRWYVKNSLGTNGVITYSRIAGSNDGSKYGASIQITTAPTASQANGTELYQTLENLDSVRLYNQSASFSIKLKALGNVNQAGVQFYYKTTEAKVDTGIGSEQTCAISTGSFATCSISGQALGTSQTTSGVIGIRIRITGVSTGNTYDLNNGIIAEQAMMVEGTTTVSFASKFQSAAAELLALQRYYEKSYDLSVDPATTSNTGGYRYRNPFGGDNTVTVVFKATKKSTPSIVFYNPSSGSTGTAREDGGNDRSLSIDGTAGLSSAPVLVTGGSQNQYTTFHWTSDAEI